MDSPIVTAATERFSAAFLHWANVMQKRVSCCTMHEVMGNILATKLLSDAKTLLTELEKGIITVSQYESAMNISTERLVEDTLKMKSEIASKKKPEATQESKERQSKEALVTELSNRWKEAFIKWVDTAKVHLSCCAEHELAAIVLAAKMLKDCDLIMKSHREGRIDDAKLEHSMNVIIKWLQDDVAKMEEGGKQADKKVSPSVPTATQPPASA